MKENNKVFLGLSTNIGSKEENLRTALSEIEGFAKVEKISSFYKTPPYGYRDQDDFLNMATEISTELTAIELIVKLQEVEHKMGRVREIKNGPRVIDIDILLYKDEIIKHPNLKVPHPEMHKRNFVLAPLTEIAPETKHPTLNQKIKTLQEELINPDKVEIWIKKN